VETKRTRARHVTDLLKCREDIAIVGRRGGDDRWQKGGDTSCGERPRQMTNRVRVGPDFNSEPAIHLQIDQPWRNDLNRNRCFEEITDT
jgi:hypothetical protein